MVEKLIGECESIDALIEHSILHENTGFDKERLLDGLEGLSSYENLRVLELGVPLLDSTISSTRKNRSGKIFNLTLYSSENDAYQSHRVYKLFHRPSSNNFLLSIYSSPCKEFDVEEDDLGNCSLNVDLSVLPISKKTSKHLEKELAQLMADYDLSFSDSRLDRIYFKSS